ncbi:hypothetical protein [Dactylosporangium darangshiense]|uniref:Uncharacterized protein n=1 Tax=Dactylosporangium darangshiense TaxID=579108 RepID=A0ABP8DUJ5_9ACTN
MGDETGRPVRYGDQAVRQGHGGETHQVAGDGRSSLTTQQGTPVGDDQNRYLRLERTVLVTGHRDLDRTNIGQHRLRLAAIA